MILIRGFLVDQITLRRTRHEGPFAIEFLVATGGGIVLAEGNRQFMRENGVVIYLQASVSALIDRLEAYPKAEQRPTLTGKPVREEVGEVLAQREALYRDAAHHIVDATASPDRVVEQIMSMLCSATATPVS